MTKQVTQWGVLLSGKVDQHLLLRAAVEMAQSINVSVHDIKVYPDLGRLAGGKYALCLEADRAAWLAAVGG